MSQSKKPLSEKNYMKRFALATRWYLADEKDSAEVIADYENMLACKTEPPQTPEQRFGTPRHAARMLAEPKAYGMWLAAFVCMSVCTLLLFIRLLPGVEYRRGLLYETDERLVVEVLLAVGILAGLLWFQRVPRPRAVPWRVLGALAALLAVSGAALARIAHIWNTLMRLELWEKHVVEGLALNMYSTMTWAGLVMAIAAVAALVAARGGDRRWRAVYVLALALLAILAASKVMLGMIDNMETFLPALMRDLIPVILIGLAGTGVALC